MKGFFAAASLGWLTWLSCSVPATAITLPDFPTAGPEEPTPVAERVDEAPCGIDNIRACFINEVGLNLDYRHAKQDFTSSVGTGPIPASSELNSTALRLEYLPLPFVSLYFLGIRHDGVGEPAGLDLDGWGWGTGITGLLPVPYTFATDAVSATPFFTTDFNYTYSDFHDIDSGVDVYSTTQRLAVGLRGRKGRLAKLGLTLLGGASFQDRPSRQSVRGAEFRISPSDTWIPVAGVVLSWFGKDKYKRPLVNFAVEGGWGDREQVSLSIRYETHAPSAERHEP